MCNIHVAHDAFQFVVNATIMLLEYSVVIIAMLHDTILNYLSAVQRFNFLFLVRWLQLKPMVK